MSGIRQYGSGSSPEASGNACCSLGENLLPCEGWVTLQHADGPRCVDPSSVSEL